MVKLNSSIKNMFTNKHKKLSQKLIEINSRLVRGGLTQLFRTHDGKRDLYDVFGYKRAITYETYQLTYERQDIAGRIIDAYPEATWRKRPDVVEIDKDENLVGKDQPTAFEEGFLTLADKVGLFSEILIADRLAGIGRYSVLFLGTDDTDDLSQPLVKGNIKYVKALSEIEAVVSRFVSDINDPNFGLPQYYTVQLGDLEGTQQSRVNVHYSRVIHIVEKPVKSRIYGQPRLERIMNRLYDLEKVIGGSAEMFWQNGRGGLQLDLNDEHDYKDSLEAMQEEVDKYEHGLTRIMRTRGITATPINMNVPDPTLPSDVLLKIIAGATGIPMRILTGSESGELASSQDENNWASRISERQENFATPFILDRFIDKAVITGTIKPVEAGNLYRIDWAKSSSLSQVDEANVANTKTTAIVNYANSPLSQQIVPVEEFREKILDLPPSPEQVDDFTDEPLEDEPEEDYTEPEFPI